MIYHLKSNISLVLCSDFNFNKFNIFQIISLHCVMLLTIYFSIMKYLFLMILSFYSIFSFCQRTEGMKVETGKCYAKCLMNDQFEQKETKILEYTGKDFSNPFIIQRTVVLIDQYQKFTKENDEWISENIPAVSEKIYFVKDTNQVKDFKIRNILRKKLIKSGGFTEWKEVVCEADLTTDLITRMSKAIFEAGYPIKIGGNVDKAFKDALKHYQEKKNLALGYFDIETLNSLGVKLKNDN
jgi:hypothetical protein